jgi:hypothetical protein
MSWYAEIKSSDHASSMLYHFHDFLEWHFSAYGICIYIDQTVVLNYKSSLIKRNDWYLSKLRGFLIKWSQLGYDGVESRIENAIKIWRIKGNPKGVAIRQRSTTDGAFSDMELEAISTGVANSYRNGDLSLAGFALTRLFIGSGRRTIQLADAICSDLAPADDTETDFFLNCPRAKQVGGGFRKDFKPIFLSSETGLVVAALVRENMARLKMMGSNAERLSGRLPLFPNWRAVEIAVSEPMAERPEDFLHLPSAELAELLKASTAQLKIISERTGKLLKINARRFRRTVGTRAAQEGVSELVIAELLDHADTQNVGVYTENVPENAEAINRAVAWQLAPIAQAFTGKIVDRETDAIRGDDATSRVRTNNGKATGTCGQHGFCGARPPIACYTCRDFQPWLHGPHEEVLEDILAEDRALAKRLGPSRIIPINNRTTVAISQVIQLCNARKKSLHNGGHHAL